MLGEVHLSFAKIHSLKLQIFFPPKLSSLKVYKKFLGRTIERRVQNPVKHLRWSFLLAVNYFRKNINLRCWTGFWNASGISNLSWTKRFATALIIISFNRLNCQNVLCSRGMQVGYFLLNTYKYFNREVR